MFKHYDLIIYAARTSNSARTLAASLGCRRWRDDLPERYARRRPYFRGSSSPLVIDWGSTVSAQWLSDPRFRLKPRWVNKPEAISLAVDKRRFFSRFQEDGPVSVLKATTERAVASEWLRNGHGVVARKTVSGSGGSGIVIVQPGEGLVEAPLYTRYYPKTHEFRVHVWRNKVIDLTQKRLGQGHDNPDRNIRSLDNGWIHSHNVTLLQGDRDTISRGCIDCIRSLGLDFGAVDVLAILRTNRALKSYRICEVNTGPGLENTQTINAYVASIMHEHIGR